MGAVDEEAQCLHNLSNPVATSLNASADESPSIAAAAAAAAGQASSPVDSAGGTPGALEAISEETVGAGETGSDDEMVDNQDVGDGGAVDAASAAAAAAAAADPEGRRICELLMRFDPKKLRAEFQQLYLDRMHNWRAVVPTPEQPSLAPEINEQSRILAERVAQRQRDESGGVAESHMDLMRWRQTQVEAKKSEMRCRREIEEVKQCTFQPSIKSRPRSASPVTDWGSGYSRLYNDSSMRQKDREKKATAMENHRSTHELDQCTFQPDLKKSVKSFSRNSTGGSPPPRGYDQCTQRLRRAFATQAPRRQFLEDRFQATSPTRRAAEDPQRIQATRQKSPAKSSRQVDEYSNRGKHSDPGRRTPRKSSPGRSAPVTHRFSAGSAPSPSHTDTHARPQQYQRPAPAKDIHFEQYPTYQSDTHMAAQTHQFEHCSELPISGHSHFMMVAPPQGAQLTDSHASRSSPESASTAKIETDLHDWKNAGSSPQEAFAPDAGQHSQKASLQSSGSRSNVMTHSQHDGDRDNSTSLQDARSSAQPPPLVYVEVNIAAGRPPEKLVLIDGQKPAEAATQFAARHNLTPALAERLTGLLQQLLASKPKVIAGSASGS